MRTPLLIDAGYRSPSPSLVLEPAACSAARLRSLQQRMHDACNVPRSCHGNYTCGQLEDRRVDNQRCADLRQVIMNDCFDGGDAGHQQAWSDAINARDFCSSKKRQLGC